MNIRRIKRIETIILTAFLALGTIGCGKQAVIEEKAQSEDSGLSLNVIDDKYRTTYEVFVYSFYDSDGDGIGDLKGLTQKLDYINDGDDETDTDLGCNEIWLMPICPSPTYHKYDVTDYMDIDPEYGTMDDFDELISKCHERGVNVIVDTVFNHTSVEHPWFTEAAGYIADNADIISSRNDTVDRKSDESTGLVFLEDDLELCPYLSYYNFSYEKSDGYEPLSGTDFYYEARFWSGMPDLNLDNDKVKEELSEITQFWIDHGVDGFRLDAVSYYYTGDDSKNIEFLAWLNDTVKAQKEDAYIVGECWTNSSTYTKYYSSGVDSFFDFDFAGSEGVIAGIARGTSSASNYADALVKMESAISDNGKKAIDAPFYTNHDMARSAGYYTGKGSQDKVKLAGALNLLMTGNAFIYYGEELGMKGSGKDENKRAPMLWSSTDATGMCDGPADMDSFDMKYGAFDEQAIDEYSIYNYYKAAIRLRNIFPVIARGTTGTVKELSDSDVCAFTRSKKEGSEYDFETDSLLIVINASDEVKTVDLSLSDEIKEYRSLVYSLNTAKEDSSLDGDKLTIPAFGIAVFSK